MKLWILLVILFWVALFCKPFEERDAWVNASDGLRMRVPAYVEKSKLGNIPNGAKVKVIDEKPDIVKVGKVKGKWTKVYWNGKSGWVFGGYLSYEAPSEKNGLAIPPKLLGLWTPGGAVVSVADKLEISPTMLKIVEKGVGSTCYVNSISSESSVYHLNVDKDKGGCEYFRVSITFTSPMQIETNVLGTLQKAIE